MTTTTAASRLLAAAFKHLDELRVAATNREDYGRVVRAAWRSWAKEQPDVGEHERWLLQWSELEPREREVDMMIAEAVLAVHAISPTQPPPTGRSNVAQWLANGAVNNLTPGDILERAANDVLHLVSELHRLRSIATRTRTPGDNTRADDALTELLEVHIEYRTLAGTLEAARHAAP